MVAHQEGRIACRPCDRSYKALGWAKKAVAWLTIVALFGSGIFSSVSATEQANGKGATDDSQPALAIEAEAVIGPSAARKIVVDLGSLPTDRPAKLTLHIVNHTGEKLNYDEVQVSCGCMQAELHNAVIEDGKAGICGLILDTRSKQRSQVISMPIRLSNSKAPHEHCVILFKAYLQGYLGFIEPYVTRELGRGQPSTEIAIPFAATVPVGGDEVEVSLNPVLGTTRIEAVEEEKDRWNVLLTVRSDDIPKEGLATVVTIKDAVSARQSQCTLMICHDHAVQISPRTIRVSQDKDSFTFNGSCIVTIRDLAASASDAGTVGRSSLNSTSSAGLPIVSAMIRGTEALVKVQRLSDEHFRVAVQIPGEVFEAPEAQDAPNGLKIDWSISSKAGAIQTTTPVAVMPRGL
jgi:hypothetical protein